MSRTIDQVEIDLVHRGVVLRSGFFREDAWWLELPVQRTGYAIGASGATLDEAYDAALARFDQARPLPAELPPHHVPAAGAPPHTLAELAAALLARGARIARACEFEPGDWRVLVNNRIPEPPPSGVVSVTSYGRTLRAAIARTLAQFDQVVRAGVGMSVEVTRADRQLSQRPHTRARGRR